MFCPNCGNDCADAMFCSECEQTLPCTETPHAAGIPDPPMGRYDGVDGFIELSYYTLTIHKEILEKTVEHVMSYRDIADVVFRQASTNENGYVLISESEDLRVPIENALDAMCDEKAIVFERGRNDGFCRLNVYLQKCLASNVERESTAENVGYKQMQNAANRGKMFCPKCKSDKYYVRPHSMFRLNKYNSNLPIKLFAACAALYYGLQRKKGEYVCRKCGYQWSKR